jgi:hypothetical protein
MNIVKKNEKLGNLRIAGYGPFFWLGSPDSHSKDWLIVGKLGGRHKLFRWQSNARLSFHM